MLHNPNATWGPWKTYTTDYYGAKVANLPIFYIVLKPSYGHQSGEAAALTVGRAFWSDDTGGNFTETTCYLLPAIVDYHVSIAGNVVSVDSSDSEPRILRLANNTHALGLPESTGEHPHEVSQSRIANRQWEVR